jgi:DNA-directed RNA polymerase subunit M
MLPKKEGKKTIVACSRCSYKTSDIKDFSFKESVKKEEKTVSVVESDIETLPTTPAECKKCGNDKAYYWEVQTRAADEPATKFLKCTKCKHIWRDYS